jgi:short-subunit dehydrogenase
LGLLARNSHALQNAKQEAEQAGGEAIAIPTDVADDRAVQTATETVERKLGPIDVWVNNAMATVFSPVHQMTAQEFRRATEVTYLGAVNGTLCVLPRMLERNRGTIVQVGSALSYQAIPLQSAYCASKFALRAFSDSLRSELIHKKTDVWVTSVHLPALNTPQFTYARAHLAYNPRPVPPTFEPEVAARAIVWAAGRRRREVWVGGPTIKTILGSKLFPKLAEHRLAKVGYAAQQTDQPIQQDRPDNLNQAVGYDPGKAGPFNAEAKPRSLAHWHSRHRRLIGLASTGLFAATLLALRTLRRVSA